MRRFLVILAVLLGGCLKRPAFQCATDAECGAAGICEGNGFCSFADGTCTSGRRFGELAGPAASVCVGETPSDVDAPGPVCPGDRDCDEILDGADNCPDLANPDQDNEDGDAFGDTCDLCPGFSDAGEDADGDRVGDRCDPNPNTAGDAIVEFLGFEHGIPATWNATNGFSTSGGNAVAVANGLDIERLMRAAPPGTHYSVYAQATLDAISGAALGAIGVSAAHAPGTDDQVLCQSVGLANGMQHELRLFDTSTTPPLLLDADDRPFDTDQRFTLELHRDGVDYDCTATDPPVITDGFTMFSPSSPEVGLRVRSVSARYHWVMIVRSP